MPQRNRTEPSAEVVPEREGHCPTCGQHHLAEMDTEELHALLTECNRLERDVLAQNDRLKQQLAAAVDAIRKAPHARHCDAGAPMWPGPCTCWKREWLDAPGSASHAS